jgi:HlyD family secretion protein
MPPGKRWIAAGVAVAVVTAFAFLGPIPFPARQAPPPAAASARCLLFRGRIEPVGGIHQVGAYGGAPTETLALVGVVEGEQVAQGQVLARLASEPQARAAHASAVAAVAVAERRLDNIRRPWKEAELEVSRAALRARAAEAELAERQQRRSETLQARGAATLVDQDVRATELRTARARLREAEAALAAVEQVPATRIALEEAQLDEARARAAEAAARLDLTLVRAPVAGTVLAIHARAGQALGQGPGGSRILDLADLSRLKFVAEVDERFVARLRPGQSATVRLRAGDASWPATVARIGNRVELVTRPTADAVTGIEARFVEVDLAPVRSDGVPAVSGLEVIVRFAP